jgi:hypothetical protein
MTQLMQIKSSAPADSRPEGGNESKITTDSLTLPKVLQKHLDTQWSRYTPEWFITIQWTPAATTFDIASEHAKLFRNKLLTSVYNCHLKKIPEPLKRCKLVWFHEKAQDSYGRIIYHSHLHLTALPEPYSTQTDLEILIATNIAPGFKCLKHLWRKYNAGIVIKPWIYERHAFYNLKDYYRFKYCQDSDLVPDCLLSDLIFAK